MAARGSDLFLCKLKCQLQQPTQPARPAGTFLARSGLLAGATVTGSLELSRSAYAAGSDKIRIGLIGCGGRGAGAASNALAVNPQAHLTALADAFPDRMDGTRQALKAQRGDQVTVERSHCFSGFDAYRQLLASGVDVVLLAEPPHFRPLHLEAAIDAGAHVFSEKPMAVDAPGVRRVLAAGEKAREKNLSFVSGFETRYADSAREAVRRVHDGALGEIVAIEGVYNTGPLWHRGRQPDWTEMEFQMRNWYYFTWLSGDHIVEQHVHYLDYVGWLLHEEPPLHAWGYGGRSQRVEAKFGDIFDHHSIVYEYPRGLRVYALTRQQSGCYNGVYSTVLGTRGHLRRGGTRRDTGIFDARGQLQWQPPPDRAEAEVNTFREMFAGIESGRPINDSVAMARSTMLAILGRMATHSGQRIAWADAFASNKVLAPERYAWDAPPPLLPNPDGTYPHPVPGRTQVL
ncbi:MAG: Gfo/Idh/MocA family oxidoreductase [Verrucomicrobia bacterium]|nr:Gfo/Idh/MocA family oxidoreductase [Verrucomicrobiota bacterium]